MNASTTSAIVGRNLKLLYIGGQQDEAESLRHAMARDEIDVTHASSVTEAVRRSREESFDAAMLDISPAQSDEQSWYHSLRSKLSRIPIVLLRENAKTMAQSDAHKPSIDHAQHPADHADVLVSRLREAAAAHARVGQGVRSTARSSTWSDEERRHAPRYMITRPVVAIPVLDGGAPDELHLGDGFTIDISQSGMAFEIAATGRPVTRKWIVGVEMDDGEMAFIAVAAREIKPSGIGLRLAAEFLKSADDPLSASRITPRLDHELLQFTTEMSSEVLNRWVDLGVVQPRVLDRVQTCPRCFALPRLRYGCRACGSIDTQSEQLIHHFACAHVDYAEQFQGDNFIFCRKCRARDLIVGADFEYLRGQHSCRKCGWLDAELDTFAQCLRCEFCILLEQTVEIEVIGYHVERMEPLDLITAC